MDVQVAGRPSSNKRFCIQQTSARTLATPLYSAFVLDLEMVVCRFDKCDRRLLPRKMQYPDVDLWISGQPA